jgi:hypothetical protein
MALPYDGPYEVLQRGEKLFKLKVGGREEMLLVDRLKPHLGTAPPAVGQPPRRGRQPGTSGEV